MKIYNDIKQRSEAWFLLRSGKITGTTLGKLVTRPTTWRRAKGEKRKVEFYQMVAARLGVGQEELTPESEAMSEENAMARGTRLEADAVKAFEKATGLMVKEAGFCESEENESIGFSPDGLLQNFKNGKYDECIEIKCLGSARHLQAYFEQFIHQEYESQYVQAFIVNNDLKKLHFIYYNPDVKLLPYHTIVVERRMIEEKIEWYKNSQEEVLKEVYELTAKLLKKL